MRDWLTKDLGWKLFSIVLAVILWLTVRNVSVESGAPGLLAIQNTFTNVVVSGISTTGVVPDVQIEPADRVSVTLSGAPDVLATLDARQLHAIVNLTGVNSAVKLERRVEVAVPPRVTLLKIDPPSVFVTMPPNP